MFIEKLSMNNREIEKNLGAKLVNKNLEKWIKNNINEKFKDKIKIN